MYVNPKNAMCEEGGGKFELPCGKMHFLERE